MFISERLVRSIRRGPLAVLAFTLVFFAPSMPSATAAQPVLIESTLVNGSQFESRPFRVVFTFAEPVVRLGIGLSRNAVEVPIAVPKPGSSASEAFLDLPALASGPYVLRWTASSSDAIASGVLRFTVTEARPPAPTTATSVATTIAPIADVTTTLPPPASSAVPEVPESTSPRASTPPSTPPPSPPSDAIAETSAAGSTSRPPIESTTPGRLTATTEPRVPLETSTVAPEPPPGTDPTATPLSPPVVLTTKPTSTRPATGSTKPQVAASSTTLRTSTATSARNSKGSAKSDAPTTISPSQLKDPTDPNLEFDPNTGRRTTTIVLNNDRTTGTRSDGSPVEIPLRTFATTSSSSVAQSSMSATSTPATTNAGSSVVVSKESGPRTPNRLEGLRSGLGIVGVVALLATFATILTRRTPKGLRVLLLNSAAIGLATVGLVSMLGIADELLAQPRESIRVASKIVGALSFLGAGALRYLVGDRTLPKRQIALDLRTQSTGSVRGRALDAVMGRFNRIAAGQLLFLLLQIAGSVLLMSR